MPNLSAEALLRGRSGVNGCTGGGGASGHGSCHRLLGSIDSQRPVKHEPPHHHDRRHHLDWQMLLLARTVLARTRGH